jgi:hypothetical protein
MAKCLLPETTNERIQMPWIPQPTESELGTITTDERQELMKAGKCFTCKKQGHLSRDCPQKVPYVPRARAAQTNEAALERRSTGSTNG